MGARMFQHERTRTFYDLHEYGVSVHSPGKIEACCLAEITPCAGLLIQPSEGRSPRPHPPTWACVAQALEAWNIARESWFVLRQVRA